MKLLITLTVLGISAPAIVEGWYFFDCTAKKLLGAPCTESNTMQIQNSVNVHVGQPSYFGWAPGWGPGNSQQTGLGSYPVGEKVHIHIYIYGEGYFCPKPSAWVPQWLQLYLVSTGLQVQTIMKLLITLTVLGISAPVTVGILNFFDCAGKMLLGGNCYENNNPIQKVQKNIKVRLPNYSHYPPQDQRAASGYPSPALQPSYRTPASPPYYPLEPGYPPPAPPPNCILFNCA
uniref:VM domain-containing protein n=1 Tax=Glossina pallidipes TaxID=7398 RepID=A0A1A9ZAK6_GLOPL